MNWTIEMANALFTVTLTGSAAFGVWSLLAFVLGRWGYARWCRKGLWVVVLMYILPVVHGGMLWNRKVGGWGGVLFWPTQAILKVAGKILFVWGIGTGILVCRLVVVWMAQHRAYRTQIPCEREIQEIFHTVCREAGLKEGKVALVWDYRANVPGFMGILHPRVVLPLQRYTDEQMRLIFLHELTHYKQRDIYLLALTMLVQSFQWFQPLVWKLGIAVRQYSEFSCDEKVCGEVGGRKIYFDTIFEVMCISNRQKGLLSMHIVEDINEIVRRKKYMRNLEKRKKKPVVLAVLLSLGVVMSCSVSVVAAADEIGKQYQKWYTETVTEVEEKLEEPVEYEEFTDHGPADGIVEEEAETIPKGRSVGFEWTVKGNTSKKTSGFSAAKGQKISVNVWVTPGTKSVKVGIVDSSGTRTYVTGKDSINHDFSIKKKDTYRVFVENTNASSVDVDGSYAVR